MNPDVTADEAIEQLSNGAEKCPSCGAGWTEHPSNRSMVHTDDCVLNVP